MQGAGLGTILGGRYSLRRRLSQGRDLERWSAHDTTLERPVALTVIYSDHPNRAGILDAARRAAGVEDSRLVRILDVGNQDGNSFIVEEAMTGAETLAAILHQGALPAEEARRIAGETASALGIAAQRGLHHLRLTPHCVLRAPDGMIKVIGVAVHAAIDGPDEHEPDPAAASRRDAVCAVAVAYAALTTRWPLDEEVSGIEPAPRVVGGVAAPSEIAAGVPGDLDALCRMTLNEDAGPLTPGDFASQIAPWSRGPVYRTVVGPTVALPLPPLPGAGKVNHEAPASAGGTEPTMVFANQDLPTPDASPSSTAAVPEPVAGPAAPTVPTMGHRTAVAGAAAGRAVGTAVASAGAAAGAAGGKVGSFARGAADKAAAASDKAIHSHTHAGGQRITLREVFPGRSDDLEPPLPMLPASTAQAPSRGQSKIVIMIVAAFVTLSLVVAYLGLGDVVSKLSFTPKRTASLGAPRSTPAPSATAQATAEAPGAGGPIAILSAAGFDPEGDRNEKDSQAARVYDGNLTTAWTSEGYNSPDFGGLKKGVGVSLDLGQPTSVKEATIDLGKGPVDLTVYAAPSASLEGANAIGTLSAASGRVTLTPDSELPQAQYLIIWITRLAPDGGRFRASISEIALS